MKHTPRHYFSRILFLLFLAIGIEATAQIQVNPSVKWDIVRSQNITLSEGSHYQFEFPAKKRHDYVFNLFYEQKDFIASIQVFDMQYQPIRSRTDSSAVTNTSLEFRVPHDATYVVLVNYKSPLKTLPNLKAQLTLIERPEI